MAGRMRGRTAIRTALMLILLGYGITLYVALPAYIDLFSVNTVLGLTAIIFTWHGGVIRKFSWGWLVAVAALLLLYGWLPAKFILYSVIGIAVFSLMETLYGRAGRLAILSLILMSPLCEYFATVFGFPIRLWLTQMAGYILHSIDNGYRT